MCENKKEMTLRNCYDKNEQLIEANTPIEDYVPLQELLDLFESLRQANTSAPLEKAG